MLLGYLLVLTFIVIYLVHLFFSSKFNYWKDRNVAHQKPVILFGNYKDVFFRKKTPADIFRKLYHDFPDQKVVGAYRMITPCILLRDLDVIKHILIKDFDYFNNRGIEFSKEGLGTNLFHSDGETWRVLRNRFTPIFTSGKLKNMLYLINEKGDKCMEYISNLKEAEQAIHDITLQYTMSTIAACAFGLDVDTNSDKIDALKKIDELLFTMSYISELDMLYPGIMKKLNLSLFPPGVKPFFIELVKQVMAQRNYRPSNKNDFMDLLLELRAKGEIESSKRNDDEKKLTLELTDDVIAGQALVFLAAGYETSATTTANLLFHIAHHPDIQEKLALEIKDVLAKNKGIISYESLKEMEYLEKVFCETLRMHPVVEPLQRQATADYKVPGTDVVIKKGQVVMVSALGIHYDENYYPNPEKFDPERFNQTNRANRNPCVFLPFGVGPRACIGARFARLQSRVFVVKFLSKFRVTPCKKTQSGITYDPTRILLRPNGGIHLNIYKREHDIQ